MMKSLKALALTLGIMGSAVAYAEDTCSYELADYDPESAIKVCQKELRTSPNDSDLQLALGNAYDNLEEYSKAFTWYLKAAKQGNTDALYNVGNMYETGEGVKQNSASAIEWYTKAADLGDSEAQYKVGSIYDEGEITTQNYKKALQWYTKSANQDHPEAQFSLAILHLYGKGTTKSEKIAREWFSKACNNWHPSACQLK